MYLIHRAEAWDELLSFLGKCAYHVETNEETLMDLPGG
jgi:hypothetical protein